MFPWSRFASGWSTLALCCCLALIGAACSPKPPLPNRETRRAVATGGMADDTARFLAGFPAHPGSPYTELEKSKAWRAHRLEMDAMWSPVETQWLPKMRAFQRAELSSQPILRSPVFYPFSGPDVLAMLALFPNHSLYVMVGLEPAGTLPQYKELEKADLERWLGSVREAVYSELHRSFFVTREMDRMFRGQVTDGLAVPILMLLARSHHQVLGLRYVRLDEAGKLVERPSNYKAPGRIGNKGIEIIFSRGQDAPPQSLYYFSVNLSDPRLRINPQFSRYLDSLGELTTFLKATSYMPHHREFSLIREEILQRSVAILQDDSGIPYRFLQQGPWRIQLYGSYEQPYGSFRYLKQDDLRAAYETGSAKPLGFRIGYGFGRVPSNLLLAIRTASRASR